jgi:hypothetical protein
VDEGDDTLTESCEDAINFMVIEIRVGSLQELPVVKVVENGLCGMGMRQAEMVGTTQAGFFVFIKKDGWMDQLRQAIGVPL